MTTFFLNLYKYKTTHHRSMHKIVSNSMVQKMIQITDFNTHPKLVKEKQKIPYPETQNIP